MTATPLTSRAQQAEKMKTAIIEAAIPLFARGYDSVSIQQIAAAAEVKHSLVMYHFGSKDQLWQAAALSLMQRFDACLNAHAADLLAAYASNNNSSDADAICRQMTAFILALRDLPEYGQMLFSEGSQQTERLTWLHEHFFPSILQQTAYSDERIPELIMHTTLLRNAVAGALLFNVVAGPQLARSAELEGRSAAADIYPMSDAMATKLARMMTGFLLSELQPGQPT